MPMRSNLAFRPEFLNCSICNEAVELETAKIDEVGKPVHEECYVEKISVNKAARPPTRSANVPKDIDSLPPQEIVEFLDSISTRSASNYCPYCGSPLDWCHATAFYRGQDWEFPLRYCVKCYSIIRVVPPHDA
jgi:hypothetical protein